MEQLRQSPMPARVCDNCGQYMLPPRCGVCGWVPDDDDDDAPFLVDDDTDLFVPDTPGGESGE